MGEHSGPSASQGSSHHGSLSVEFLPAEQRQDLASRYLLYLPAEPVGERLPLILSLHGSGERGDDPSLVRVHGIPRRLDEGAGLPFVVLAPQCPAGKRWQPASLVRLLDHVGRTAPVDPGRIYVTGLSMGGSGTWAVAIAYPERFAAIAPICGSGNPSAVCAIAHVPVSVFHGALDPVVPLERSVEMVEALRACSGNVRLTVFPDAGHDSWTQAYAGDDLYRWFLSHRRRTPA